MTPFPHRPAALLLAVAASTLALLPAAPFAAASHCGDSLTVASVSPTGSVPIGGPILLEARFDDALENCGIAGHEMTLDGVPVEATATAEGSQYVVRYLGSANEGTHTVYARVVEVCCPTLGSGNVGEATWQFTVECDPTPGVEVCVTTTTVIGSFVAQEPQTANTVRHPVAGHVDLYRFTLPGGIVTTLPCVVLSADGNPANPCADAGGAFISRVTTLLDTGVYEQDASLGDAVAHVGVCNAILTLTVNDVGINAAPIVTTC